MPTIPERKSSFQKTVFTQPQSGSTIILVSETECEIENRGSILLAEYSRQDNKLRVVIRAGGAVTVSYFELFPDGLRSPDSGQVFLLPEPLSKYNEQLRIAKEVEEARQKAERDRIAQLLPLKAQSKQFTREILTLTDPEQEAVVTITDTAIRVNTRGGREELFWFGCIKRVHQINQNRIFYITIDFDPIPESRNHSVIQFHTSANRDRVGIALDEAIKSWNIAYKSVRDSMYEGVLHENNE